MIRILFTKNIGQVIADVTESVDGQTLTLKNPCSIQIGNSQVGLLPLLSVTKEDTMMLPTSELITNQLFEAEDTIYNHYNQQFGSGIELITNPGNGSILR